MKRFCVFVFSLLIKHFAKERKIILRTTEIKGKI
jgi:hypothetical protein